MSYKCLCGEPRYAMRQRVSVTRIFDAEHNVREESLDDKAYRESTRCFCPVCGRDVTPRVLADKGERPPMRERKTTQNLVESMNKAIDENFKKDPKLMQDCIDAACEYLEHRLKGGI